MTKIQELGGCAQGGALRTIDGPGLVGSETRSRPGIAIYVLPKQAKRTPTVRGQEPAPPKKPGNAASISFHGVGFLRSSPTHLMEWAKRAQPETRRGAQGLVDVRAFLERLPRGPGALLPLGAREVHQVQLREDVPREAPPAARGARRALERLRRPHENPRARLARLPPLICWLVFVLLFVLGGGGGGGGGGEGAFSSRGAGWGSNGMGRFEGTKIEVGKETKIHFEGGRILRHTQMGLGFLWSAGPQNTHRRRWVCVVPLSVWKDNHRTQPNTPLYLWLGNLESSRVLVV